MAALKERKQNITINCLVTINIQLMRYLALDRHTPPQDHIGTARRCCCCPRASSHCVWCLPLEDQGGTEAPRPPRGARHRGSPPGKSENETSPWKTVEWSGLPSRHSSDKREERVKMRQLIRLVSFNCNDTLQKWISIRRGSQMTAKEEGWWLNKYVGEKVRDRKTKKRWVEMSVSEKTIYYTDFQIIILTTLQPVWLVTLIIWTKKVL